MKDKLNYFVDSFKENKIIDITSSFDLSVSKRREFGLEMHRLSQFGLISPKRSAIRVSPQAVTHLDLPWHFQDKFLKKFNDEDFEIPPFFEPEAVDYIDKKYINTKGGLCKNPCVIINLSSVYKDFLKKLISNDTNGMPENYIYIGEQQKKTKDMDVTRFEDTEYLFDPFTENENLIEEICQTLAIDLNIFHSLLTNNDNIENTIIIFKTCWNGLRGFTPKIRNLNNPIWEGLHPYLLHPFLKKDLIDFLIEKNVLGIGCDCPELENPLLYFVKNKTLEHLLKARERYYEKYYEAPFYLHGNFLSRNKYLIENLDLSVFYSNKEPCIRGELYIFPLPSYAISDAMVCKVFFRPYEEFYSKGK